MKKRAILIFLVIILTLICFGKFIPASVEAKTVAPKNISVRQLAEIESDDEGELNELPVIPGEDSPSPLVVPTAPEPEISTSDISLPWYVTRAAGIASYALMFCIIVLGEGMTTGFAYRFMTPIYAWTVHKYLGIAFGITILAHILSLLFDKFVSFGLAEILIPFASNYNPFFLSLGILGFYLILLIILSSLFVRLRLPFFWRYVHYLVYPLFILGFFHGVFMGTDTKTLSMQILYSLTGAVFFFLIIHRWRFHLSRV